MFASVCFRCLIQPFMFGDKRVQVAFRVIAGVWCFLVAGLARQVNAEQFNLSETESNIEIHSGDRSLLRYNKVSPPAPEGIDSVYQRSGFLHPVCTPAGKIVTASFPFDHPHQQGVFSAWVRTTYDGRKIDFWNLAKKTGCVAHQSVVNTFSNQQRTGFVVELVHRSEQVPPIEVLSERWEITAVPTDGTYDCFDLRTRQRALTGIPLKVENYHYGGVAIRGPVSWLTAKGADARSATEDDREAAGFINSLGSNRLNENHQRPNWVTMWGMSEGHPVSITVLCGRSSFRSPQSTRLHPTKPYFCFCPCVESGFIIDQQHPYVAQYRFLMTDAKPGVQWLQQRWQEFTSH